MRLSYLLLYFRGPSKADSGDNVRGIRKDIRLSDLYFRGPNKEDNGNNV